VVAHQLAGLLRGRLEAEDEDRLAIFGCLRQSRLLGIEQTAVRRVEARLREGADSLRPRRKGIKRDPA
jgi:hypothetical protein